MGLENPQNKSVSFGRQHPKFVIAELQKAAQQYAGDPNRLPMLNRRARRNLSAGVEKFIIDGQALANRDMDLDCKQMRRERRQACAAVVSAFLYVVEIKSGTCKIALQKIADTCGLCSRRVDRVVSDLRAAGILMTIRRPKPVITHAGKKYLCALRRFNPAFLRLCLPGKLAEWWNKAGGSMPPYSDRTAMDELHRAAFAAHLSLPPKPPPEFAAAAGVMRGWINT